MSYVYQPFPRMLYRGEDQRIVADHHEELAALADGWRRGGAAPEPVAEPVVASVPAEALTAPERHFPVIPMPIEEPPIAPTITLAEDEDPVVIRRRPGRPRKVAI